MLQKTIWTICSIIGINIILVSVNGCKNKSVALPIKTATYVYYNKMAESIQLEIKNGNMSTFVEIKSLDSALFIQEGELPNPFHGKTSGNIVGDSTLIIFNKIKCTSYSKDFSSGTYDGTGVFNLKEYDNYSQDLVNQKSYTLRYTIDSTDYKKAVPCK